MSDWLHGKANDHPIVCQTSKSHIPLSAGISEWACEQVSAAECASSAERANKWAVRSNGKAHKRIGPVLRFQFLVVLNHRAKLHSARASPFPVESALSVCGADSSRERDIVRAVTTSNVVYAAVVCFGIWNGAKALRCRGQGLLCARGCVVAARLPIGVIREALSYFAHMYIFSSLLSETFFSDGYRLTHVNDRGVSETVLTPRTTRSRHR